MDFLLLVRYIQIIFQIPIADKEEIIKDQSSKQENQDNTDEDDVDTETDSTSDL